MKKLPVIFSIMAALGFQQAQAATCAIPEGTYQYIMSDGAQSYYFSSNNTVRVAGNTRVLETGDFDISTSGERFERDGDLFTYTNEVGVYEKMGSGPIYYVDGQYMATASVLPVGSNYNDQQFGTYRKEGNGKISFTPKRKLKPLVITQANCNQGVTLSLNYDTVVTDLGARREGGNMIVDLDSDILFAYDSDKISPKAANKLSQLGFLINHDRKGMVILRGHTDSKGSDDYNTNLSQKRAQSVANYLTKNSSVPVTAIMAQGLGETYPKAANTNADGSDNPQGRAINRRVEVIIQAEADSEVPQPRAVIVTPTVQRSVVAVPHTNIVVKSNDPASIYPGVVQSRTDAPSGSVITYTDGTNLSYSNAGGAYVLTKPDGTVIQRTGR